MLSRRRLARNHLGVHDFWRPRYSAGALNPGRRVAQPQVMKTLPKCQDCAGFPPWKLQCFQYCLYSVPGSCYDVYVDGHRKAINSGEGRKEGESGFTPSCVSGENVIGSNGYLMVTLFGIELLTDTRSNLVFVVFKGKSFLRGIPSNCGLVERTSLKVAATSAAPKFSLCR